VNVGSTQPPRLRMATPERGQHNDEILREFGYTDTEIGSLRERKVI
jgi:crotonobetainyl-CoA:carnitine CoA-transferase CaiB-like acyl-CoA transferase